VLAYTNCDSVELFVNGKSFGIKALQFPRPGNSGSWNRYDVPPVGVTTGDLHLMWDVPYEAGTLKAVGRKGGKIVVEEEIKTAGAPAAFRLSVDRNTIHADETDVAHVKIEVLDDAGNIVPNANIPVHIIVEGEGRLIGLDNGNPVDHTSMKSDKRNTFNGLALAVVQSNNKPGKIRVRTSSSLKNTSIEITTEKTSIPIPVIEVVKK
jgi:beta-galactosidase